jgi:hypothetical protein
MRLRTAPSQSRSKDRRHRRGPARAYGDRWGFVYFLFYCC